MIPKGAIRAAAVCGAILAARGAPAHAADAVPDTDTSTWTIRCEDFFGDGKPLNVYASRREGKWVWGLGSSRIPGTSRNGWNVARYVADLSGLKREGDAIRGTVAVLFGPDPWVPKDHRPRRATIDVEARFTAPDPKDTNAKAFRGVQGTYRTRQEAGLRDPEKPCEFAGAVAGNAAPTEIDEPDDVTYGLCFQNLIPGGQPTDNQRRLWVGLGVRGGKVVSARVGPMTMRHEPYDLQFIETPEDVRVDKDGARGRLGIPTTSFDGEPVTIAVEFSGGRVQGFLSGTYTAACVTAEGKEEKRACTWDGVVSAGAMESRFAKDDRPWFVTVPGWRPVEPGEHPRLFFRKSDLPELRRRAETPGGKVILARLRVLLGGGERMPVSLNPAKKAYEENGFRAVPGSYSISHAAGFGFLYQLTGERTYADLARQCVELAWGGQRNFDDRYAWVAPGGELRAGPSLGWYALAYDLCYDAWDEAFRVKFAQAIQNYDDTEGGEWAKPEGISLRKLALAPKLGPNSNHAAAVCGGTGLAILAIKGDPGTDPALLEKYDAALQRQLTRNLTGGFGDGGFFYEGHGAEGVAADTAFVSYLRALRVAQGRDYVSGPRSNAAAIGVRRIWEIVGPPAVFPYRSAMGPTYGSERQYADRTGFSHGGIFSEGFGAVTDAQKPALLWCYNTFVAPDRAADTFDTVSLYPHRAIQALVNWPFGVEPRNPGEVLPKCHRDSVYEYWVFRNRWQDKDDIVVTALLNSPADNKPRGVMVWGLGTRSELPSPAKARMTEFAVAKDRSGIVSTGAAALAVDFSRASGAEALVVVAGVPGDVRGAGKDARARATTVTAGKHAFHVLTLSADGRHPEVTAGEDGLQVGGQAVTFDGKTIRLRAFAAE
ncbi:MAG: hypothetical protein LUQ37_05340 [Methanoregulaceae archaeon]|nr:hypothetical protein [Methanoregulaceae archaeon]